MPETEMRVRYNRVIRLIVNIKLVFQADKQGEGNDDWS